MITEVFYQMYLNLVIPLISQQYYSIWKLKATLILVKEKNPLQKSQDRLVKMDQRTQKMNF